MVKGPEFIQALQNRQDIYVSGKYDYLIKLSLIILLACFCTMNILLDCLLIEKDKNKTDI